MDPQLETETETEEEMFGEFETPPNEETQTPPATSATAPQSDEMLNALRELSAGVKELRQPKPDSQKKELSEEEKAELWGVWNPTKTRPDFFKKFFGLGDEVDEMTLKEKQELFQEMHQGLMRQAFTGVAHLLKDVEARIRAEYDPIREHIAEQRAQQTRSAFDRAFPVFADKRYDKVLKAAATELASSGKQFKTRDEYFKALAESAAESIRAIVPEFDLGSTPNQPKKPSGSTPRLPRTTVGGSGGIRSGGGGGGQKPNGDQSDDIFD